MKKTTAVIAVILLSATLARGTLIDLTPSGFNLTQRFPPVVANFFTQYRPGPHGLQNIAGTNIVNGVPEWSPFTIFGSDRFSLALNALGTGADAGWDLSGTGFHLRFVFVESSALIANLYAVPGIEQITGDGFVEIDGVIPLLAVPFAGRNGVADTGSTLTLMGIATVAVFFLQRRLKQYERKQT